jgi:hypothetical protein
MINLSNTTPAAPSGATNVTWQVDGSGNVSANVPIAVLVAPPAAPTSTGTPGEVAFDSAGNWYWCYAFNSWARIGPTGYGSAAASPPSW